nr:outer membrane protein assembly factor BamB [Legionella adelaidensis]
MKKNLLLISLCLLLQSCSTVDDYVFGKDNTPKPAALKPVESKLSLSEKWSVPVGKASKSATYLKLKPEISGDIIYTADTSGLIKATNKNNGHTLWSQNLNDTIISGPSLGQGYLAVGTDSSSLVLLNQKNGEKVWQVKVAGDILSKPVIYNGKVIAKTINGKLYAFNAKTGEKLWTADHGAPNLILKASSSPVIVDKVALVGFSDGKLDAVELESGAVEWQRSIAFASGPSDVERLVDIDADPIVRGNVAYLATYQGYIGALSLNDGQFIWRKPASTYKNLAMDEHTLYITDSDDIVWAFDKQSGNVKWKQIAFKARGLTEPVLMGDKIIIGDKTGFLHVLSNQDGEVLARSKVNGPIDIAPTVQGKSLYVMTTNGQLNRLTVG